jgi:hypothetical protein
MSFSSSELDLIDQNWRRLEPEHPWTGWAISAEKPEEVWIFRTQVNWRHFFLKKTKDHYLLVDDTRDNTLSFKNLKLLADHILSVPALSNHPN